MNTTPANSLLTAHSVAPGHGRPGAISTICFALLAGVFFLQSAAAQDDDIGTMYNKSVQAMNAQNWEEGLKLSEQIIKDHGEFAYDDYGPMFGGIYYNKGICLIRVRDYAKAAEAFKKCNEDFPNKKPEGKEGAPDSINPYEKTAVFQWALCEQLQGSYDEAIKLYEKFVALNPPREELQPGAYFINLGICQANVGRLDDATASIQRVFDNQEGYRVKTTSLVQGFAQLGGAWVRLADEKPEIVKAAHAFMDKYMAQLKMRPYDMHKLNPLIVRLAQDAGSARQYGLALRFYTLFAGTEDAINDLYLRSVEYGGVTAKLQDEIDRLKKDIDGGDPIDVNVLRGMAACYAGMGNHRASYIIHQNLEEHFATSKYRPQILFQATRGAALVGDIKGTMDYGKEFLENYPKDELFNDVSNLLVGALFEQKEYTRCVEIALDVKDTLDDGSAAKDLMEFVHGASNFYLEQYDKAQPLLDGHVSDYAKSQYLVNSRYFQASNLMKLNRFKEAAQRFDSYIEDYPVSPLLDIVLFERAMSEYILQEETFDRAIELIDRLENEFPDSVVLPNALLLKGDILKTTLELEGANDGYLKAKEASERLANAEVGAESLSRLVENTVQLERWEDSAKYYDEYFQKYPEERYKLEVAVIGLEALVKQERTDEGLRLLEKIIVELSTEDNAEGMEKAINGYVETSESEVGFEATIEKLTNFPGRAQGSKSLEAWLLISKIDLIQKKLKGLPKDNADYGKLSAKVKVAFEELKDFDKGDLGNYILVQLGRYITNTGNPFEAIPFFEEIKSRPNKEFEDYADLELAKIWARSKDAALQQQASDGFKRVLEVHKTKELQEDALLGLGDIAVAKEDWNAALDHFQKYQQNKSYKRQRPKANFMIGYCYELSGDLTRAQKVYLNVFIIYRGHLEWSAQSVLRNANIEWGKGTDGSKRNGYMMLRDGERLLGPLERQDESGWVRKMLNRLDEMREELQITPEMEKAEAEAELKAKQQGAQ